MDKFHSLNDAAANLHESLIELSAADLNHQTLSDAYCLVVDFTKNAYPDLYSKHGNFMNDVSKLFQANQDKKTDKKLVI